MNTDKQIDSTTIDTTDAQGTAETTTVNATPVAEDTAGETSSVDATPVAEVTPAPEAAPSTAMALAWANRSAMKPRARSQKPAGSSKKAKRAAEPVAEAEPTADLVVDAVELVVEPVAEATPVEPVAETTPAEPVVEVAPAAPVAEAAPVRQPAPKVEPPVVGTKVTGKVVKKLAPKDQPAKQYGLLVALDGGFTGLLHVSNFDGSREANDARLEAFKVGDEVTAEVTEVANDEKRPGKLRISLSERALKNRSFKESLPGTKVEGTVNGKADYGVFVDIGDGLRGLLHVTQLAGTREERDARLADLKVGDKVTVEVSVVADDEKRAGRLRLELSEKRLEQREFLASLQVGDTGNGYITEVGEAGFQVSLPKGIRGFLPRTAAGGNLGGLKKGFSLRVRIEEIDQVNLTVKLSQAR